MRNVSRPQGLREQPPDVAGGGGTENRPKRAGVSEQPVPGGASWEGGDRRVAAEAPKSPLLSAELPAPCVKPTWPATSCGVPSWGGCSGACLGQEVVLRPLWPHVLCHFCSLRAATVFSTFPAARTGREAASEVLPGGPGRWDAPSDWRAAPGTGRGRPHGRKWWSHWGLAPSPSLSRPHHCRGDQLPITSTLGQAVEPPRAPSKSSLQVSREPTEAGLTSRPTSLQRPCLVVTGSLAPIPDPRE